MSQLKQPDPVRKFDRAKLWSFFEKGNSKHMYILSLCIQYGWTRTHPRTGKPVADLGRLDGWLRGTSKSGQSPVIKPLQEMTVQETSRVIIALENMVGGAHES